MDRHRSPGGQKRRADVLPWIVTIAALLVAFAAADRSRRLTRRIDQLTKNYWDLRYRFGELQAQVNRLDPEAQPPEAPAAPPPAPSFIPLSSLKR